MGVAPAVVGLQARVGRAVEQGPSQDRAERPVEHPVAPPRGPGRVVQRAERAVGQAVGEEVQVVEHRERPERPVRVATPAHGDGEHGVDPQRAQRQDVRAVRHLVRDELVVGAVPRQVHDLGAVDRPYRHRHVPGGGGHRARLGVLEGRQVVGPGPGDDPDAHRRDPIDAHGRGRAALHDPRPRDRVARRPRRDGRRSGRACDAPPAGQGRGAPRRPPAARRGRASRSTAAIASCGPRPSTRIALRPRLRRSRPSLDVTSRPHSSFTRSSR